MKKILVVSIIVIVLSVSVMKRIKLNDNHKRINSSARIIVGKIEDYYEVGVGNHYMSYSYIVNFEVFDNKVMPKKLFRNCENDEYCIGKPIYIRYYKDDPSISEPIYDSIPEWGNGSN